jgi:glycosyltransferase involved in cell wall biosynthesis
MNSPSVDAPVVAPADAVMRGGELPRPSVGLGAAADHRRPRIAYVSYSTGQYDARTIRMARSAIAAGYDVTVYARWYPGLPVTEERGGYRLVRAPWDWRLAVPGLRGAARQRLARAMAGAPTTAAGGAGGEEPLALPGWTGRSVAGRFRRWRRIVRFFPLYPLGWAAALAERAEPADIWHGMWAGSLPALARLRRRHGGRTIYDSRDIYMESRDQADAGMPGKAILERLERHWAQAADRVMTVNASYADLLVRQLHVPPPIVVMNCPERWTPPSPRPNRIREALGLPLETAVVLYQGGLMSERGIEQAMEAILDVPGAVLCLMGFGRLSESLAVACSIPRYVGRVMLLPPVPPDELLEWTASADVSVMAIQPTSVNHLFTTPQKLFESLAAGVPVVASDLPGMAGLVRGAGVGLLCDPTSASAIAAAVREILTAPVEARERQRAHVLRVAHERFTWEGQSAALLDLYRDLL